MRLDKYLAGCGAGSRSEIKKMIRDGLVRADGVSKPRPETQIDPETAKVFLRDVPMRYRKYVYLMLYKPGGYLSATWDKHHKTVLDLVPEEYQHFDLFPVGRLDLDTEGFCLLTNDGVLAHRLLSPAHHVPKRYFARVEGQVTEEDVALFAGGVLLEDGYVTRPAELKILTAEAVSETEVTITEGKYHQIKRMFAAAGKRVIYLKRTAVSGVPLDASLLPGQLREFTQEELVMLDKEYFEKEGCLCKTTE